MLPRLLLQAKEKSTSGNFARRCQSLATKKLQPYFRQTNASGRRVSTSSEIGYVFPLRVREPAQFLVHICNRILANCNSNIQPARSRALPMAQPISGSTCLIPEIRRLSPSRLGVKLEWTSNRSVAISSASNWQNDFSQQESVNSYERFLRKKD